MRIDSFVNENHKKKEQKYIQSQNASFSSIWSNETSLRQNDSSLRKTLLAAVTHYALMQLQ